MNRHEARERALDKARRALAKAGGAIADVGTGRDGLAIAILETAHALYQLASADQDGSAERLAIESLQAVRQRRTG